MGVLIWQGDCIDLLRVLPDNSFDLCLTDPPYGIGADAGSMRRAGKQYGKSGAPGCDYGVSEWDKQPPDKRYFDEIRRVSKNQIIWGGNYFTKMLPPSPCWLVWDKRERDMTNSYADCELAWTSFKGAAKMFRFMWMGYTRRGDEERVHPTQKPVELFMWCIRMFSKEGDVIFDPYAGSGTTGIAAHRLGRQFSLAEKDARYVQLIRERLNKLVLGIKEFL